MPCIIGFSIIAGGILILWSSKTEDSEKAALPSNTNPEGFDIQKMRAARKELRRQQNLRKKTSSGNGNSGDGEAE